MSQIIFTSEQGFVMPTSASEGWIVVEPGVVATPTGAGSFALTGSALFDSVQIIYEELGNGNVKILGMAYYKNSVNALLSVVYEEDSIIVSQEYLDSGSLIFDRVTLNDDYFQATNFSDKLFGGPGNDEFFASGGNDKVHGDDGNDTMTGNSGNDVLYGDGGDDIIVDFDGNDKFCGNKGKDIFGFALWGQKDIIKDFSKKKDIIAIRKDLAKNVSDIEEVAEKYKEGVVLKFSNRDQLKIEGIKIGDLKSIDWSFNLKSIDWDFF